MTTVQLVDGRVVDVDESKARILIREGKARDVAPAEEPEAAARRSHQNYMKRHPASYER